MRAFLDENIVEIFKADPSAERETPDAARGDRLDFGVERKIAVSDRDSLARYHRLRKCQERGLTRYGRRIKVGR